MSAILRIAGVNIPVQKHIEIGLTAIYGIGRPLANKICQDVGLNPATKGIQVTSEQEALLRSAVAKYTTEGELRRAVAASRKRLADIQCYRGKRHRSRLPCRGQNTRNNARTAKRGGGAGTAPKPGVGGSAGAATAKREK